ncbi:hypothetical protein [Halorubellus salinus]|uniref:hypothetical protein n=1 Tax=Halorubellus salinus TaxID=755309 RepID=UPI001D066ED7|nr:hypothetical protein [Halorubellus salinus]
MKRFDRRTVLGLASTAGVAALAGCQALEDVASNDDEGNEGRPGGGTGGVTADPAFAIGETVFVTWVGPDGEAAHVLASDNVTTR